MCHLSASLLRRLNPYRIALVFLPIVTLHRLRELRGSSCINLQIADESHLLILCRITQPNASNSRQTQRP